MGGCASRPAGVERHLIKGKDGTVVKFYGAEPEKARIVPPSWDTTRSGTQLRAGAGRGPSGASTASSATKSMGSLPSTPGLALTGAFYVSEERRAEQERMRSENQKRHTSAQSTTSDPSQPPSASAAAKAAMDLQLQ